MPNLMKLGHEFKHGEQFLDGLFGYFKIGKTWAAFGVDLEDEANAFHAGFTADSIANLTGQFLKALGGRIARNQGYDQRAEDASGQRLS